MYVRPKGTNTLRTLLVRPKDKDPKLNTSGITYHFKCPKINCTEAYIGESGRALGDKSQGTPQGLLPHSSTQQYNRTTLKPTVFQHHTPRTTRSFLEDKGGHVHMC